VSLRRRLIAATAAALVLTGPIATAILSRADNTIAVPLAPDDRPDWTAVPVKMLTVREGDRLHGLPMFAAAPGTLLRHPRVAILLATYGGTPTLDEAFLEWLDGRCTYRSAPGAVLENNQTLDLIKDAGCSADENTAANMRLTVRLKDRDQRVAVWTYQPRPGVQAPELLRIWDGDPGTQQAGIVRGTYLEQGDKGPRRIALLNYVWNIAADPTWIWVTLAVAGGLTALSVLLITGTTGANPEARKTVASGALACTSLALALGILYATFVPPLQAPDEPAHLLAFANSSERAGMEAGAKNLARRGHFNRLRFHGDQRFRPSDVGRPWAIDWTSEVFAHDVASRSLTTFWWWKVTGGLTRGLTTPRTLLAARLANALLFAVAMGVATLLFAAAAPTTRSRLLLPIVLMSVPTLPFFATYLAEFALLTDTYILFAASLCVLLADGPLVHRIGFPLGASLALALLSGRSAAPILPLFAAALAGRVVLGGRVGTARSTAIFWASCGAGIALFPAFAGGAFSRGLWPGDTGAAAGWFRLAAGLFREHPVLLLGPVPLGYALERLFQRLPAANASGRTEGAARSVGYVMVAAVALSLMASLFFNFPTLATRETAMPPTVGAYVKQVLLVALTSLRLARPDLLLGASFWGGFGWIDAVLPAAMVTALTTIVATGLFLTGLSIARRRDIRHTVWVLLLGAGGTASLAAYAVSNYFLNRNLHGRYLVGLYVCTVLAAWTIPILESERSKMLVRFLVVGSVIAIHAYALPFVLLRYF
jgi:hypothetical protein